MVSATMSFSDTVRDGKKTCVNSIDTARAAHAANTATEATMRAAARDAPATPSHNAASGTNSSTLATQSERWPVRKSSQGALRNAVSASSNESGAIRIGTKLP